MRYTSTYSVNASRRAVYSDHQILNVDRSIRPRGPRHWGNINVRSTAHVLGLMVIPVHATFSLGMWPVARVFEPWAHPPSPCFSQLYPVLCVVSAVRNITRRRAWSSTIAKNWRRSGLDRRKCNGRRQKARNLRTLVKTVGTSTYGTQSTSGGRNGQIVSSEGFTHSLKEGRG